MLTNRWEGVKWNDTEIGALKKHFSEISHLKELSSILNRSEPSIRAKARSLGLKRKFKAKGSKWKLSQETKDKHKEHQLGNKNSNWKGNKVGYNALHTWLIRHKPKSKLCEECNKKPPYDLASINGEYPRDINNYRWLCRSCHTKLDIKLGIRGGRKNED